METSVIIRTKNEQKWLGAVLEKLGAQTYRDFEVVVVDSGSTDATCAIAQKHHARIVHIDPHDFSYPYASNVGCRHAHGTKYLCFLSGHSVPISRTWLADGIAHFRDENVAGVYGGVWALPDGHFLEKVIFNERLGRRAIRKQIAVQNVTAYRMGLLGCTNAIVRRSLWEKHHFDEVYGMGGEDSAWAAHWLSAGYHFIRDQKFSVYHSHGLGPLGLIRQYLHWRAVKKPHPFYRQKYR